MIISFQSVLDARIYIPAKPARAWGGMSEKVILKTDFVVDVKYENEVFGKITGGFRECPKIASIRRRFNNDRE